MIIEPKISLFDIVLSISDTIDLVSRSLTNHHIQVAYIAHCLADELGLPAAVQNEVVLAGSFHDIGALSLQERLDALTFELENPHKHAVLGYLLLQTFEPVSAIADIIRFHHVPWDNGNGKTFEGNPVPEQSHIIHLADRVSVLIDNDKEILQQSEEICKIIKSKSPGMFKSEMVEALMSLSSKEYFWFEATSSSIYSILLNRVDLNKIELNLDSLRNLATLFARIIDFRSRFTSTHSSGVATVAKEIFKILGMSKRECKMVEIAGYLHDLGKLAIPSEILEKPSSLSKEEYNLIKKHPFYTYRIIDRIKSLETINTWASQHHERLNGTGYPFRIKEDDLSLASRIIAISDIFTAITEDRPYRNGMTNEDALRLLQKMAKDSTIDPGIVDIIDRHFDDINSIRDIAQKSAHEDYDNFFTQIL